MTYELPMDAFRNMRVGTASLTGEVAAAIHGVVLAAVVCGPDVCSFDFEGELTAAQLATLRAVAAAHVGSTTTVKLLATSQLVLDEKAAGAEWTVLGRARVDLAFFGLPLAQIRGRVVGELATLGLGAELRVVEAMPGLPDVDLTPLPLAPVDSGDAFVPFSFSTQVDCRAGDGTYRLEGRLGAATKLVVRASSISALAIITT